MPPARPRAAASSRLRRGISGSRVRLALLACLVLTGLRALLQLVSPATPGDALALRQPEYAYATFFGSEDFLPAVQVLLHTLAATRPAHPLVLCVVEGAVSRAALAAVLHRAPMRVEVQLWTPLLPPPGSTHAPRWALNWNKLRLWQLPGYSKVLYLDADMLVLRNMDSAFEARVDRFLGTPDWGKWTRPGSAKMNGGVFLLQPSEDTFRRLVAFSRRTGRYRSLEAEQGLLNAYFGRARSSTGHPAADAPPPAPPPTSCRVSRARSSGARRRRYTAHHSECSSE